MNRFGGVTAMAAGVALLAGCGPLGGSSSTKTVTETVTGSPSSNSSGPVNLTGEKALKLNGKAELQGSTLTVSRVQQATSAASKLPANRQWWSAMVEACVRADEPLTFSWQPWSVSGADGGTYPASGSTWGDFPKPAYPFAGERPYNKGQCVKGWIMFEAETGTAPASIEYGNSEGETVTWKV